jgi:hypothetical protein
VADFKPARSTLIGTARAKNASYICSSLSDIFRSLSRSNPFAADSHFLACDSCQDIGWSSIGWSPGPPAGDPCPMRAPSTSGAYKRRRESNLDKRRRHDDLVRSSSLDQDDADEDKNGGDDDNGSKPARGRRALEERIVL